MQIRDAHEGDASTIVDLATGDIDPHFLLRERVVRVAVDGSAAAGDRDDEAAIEGFLAFDARPDVLHVTRIGGDDDAIRVLLDDAIEFAKRVTLPVEAVVLNGDSAAVALETKGFESVGAGPRFDGRETTRFRLEPA